MSEPNKEKPKQVHRIYTTPSGLRNATSDTEWEGMTSPIPCPPKAVVRMEDQLLPGMIESFKEGPVEFYVMDENKVISKINFYRSEDIKKVISTFRFQSDADSLTKKLQQKKEILNVLRAVVHNSILAWKSSTPNISYLFIKKNLGIFALLDLNFQNEFTGNACAFQHENGSPRIVLYKDKTDFADVFPKIGEACKKAPIPLNCWLPTCDVLFPQKKCGRCRMARYCRGECQKEDWPRHKQECKRIMHAIIESDEESSLTEEKAETAMEYATLTEEKAETAMEYAKKEACAFCKAPTPTFPCLEKFCPLRYCNRACRHTNIMIGHKCARPAPLGDAPSGAGGA